MVSGVSVQVSVRVQQKTGRLGSWKSWKRESFQAFWPPILQAMSYQLSATSYLP